MQLEQRRQAMLQLHMSDQQCYCLVWCVLCKRFDGISKSVVGHHVSNWHMARYMGMVVSSAHFVDYITVKYILKYLQSRFRLAFMLKSHYLTH